MLKPDIFGLSSGKTEYAKKDQSFKIIIKIHLDDYYLWFT